MKTSLRHLGLGLLASTALAAFAAPHTARAMSGTSNIEIDGGPLGPLELSGGFDVYLYAQSGASRGALHGNTIAGADTTGAYLNSFLIQLKENKDPIQFTIQIAGFKAFTLGAGRPKEATINHFTLGPLRNVYASVTPIDGLKISAGQLGSLEGYESTFPWNNPTDQNTILYYVTNSDSRGVQAEYTTGPYDVTVLFGDGTDSGVWNYLQFAGTYTFDANNNLNVSGGIALGVTGPAAYAYNQDFVGDGNELTQNYDVYSLWYSTTIGNLTLIPEIQYAYAKPMHRYAAAGAADVIPKFTDNAAGALFADYLFPNSPYSIGAWVEYAASHGDTPQNSWFVAPHARLVGVSVAPTWQYKDIFARLNGGYVHLLNGSYDGDGVTGAFGSHGFGKDQIVGMLEAGLVF